MISIGAPTEITASIQLVIQPKSGHEKDDP